MSRCSFDTAARRAVRCLVALALAIALVPLPADAQSHALRGRVVDARTGAGLPGVTVSSSSSSVDVQTLPDGAFSLTLPAGEHTLSFAFLGYATETRSVRLPSDEVVTVGLRESAIPVTGLVVNARRTESALKTRTPLLEIPQAVSMVPRRVLEQQDVQTLSDALRNVAGVALSATDQGVYHNYHVRGFYASEYGNFRRNGIETYRFADLMDANVERVEVIKGPSSVLYGNLEPGGIINVVTKQPEATPARSAFVGGGSFGRLRGGVDLTGPLGSDALLYRLNVAGQRGGSGRDGVEGDALLVAPVLAWQPAADTRLVVEAELRDRSQVTDPGLMTPGTAFATVDDTPYETFLGEPDARLDWTSLQATTTLDQRLTRALAVTATASLADYDRHPTTVSLLGLEDAGRAVRRNVDRQTYDFRYVHAEGFATLNLRTGPVEHEIVAGASLRDADGTRRRERASLDAVSLASPTPTGLPGAAAFAENLHTEQSDRLTGVFVQGQFRIGDALHLVAGLRRTGIDRSTTNLRAASPEPSVNEWVEWTPRLGLLARLRPEFSAFANFAESFVPTFNVGRDGEPFDPIYGRQFELGARGEWADGRIATTVSLYRLTKTNEVSWVFADDFGWYTVQGGRQRSEGVELEVLGDVTDRLGLQASYSWMDARVLDDPNYEAGRPLSGAPEHSGSVWATYAVTRDLRLGGGVFASGAMPSWLSSDVMKPGYATLDAVGEYRFGPERSLQVNVRNVFDARYYTGAYATTSSDHLTTNLGQARSLEVTFRSAF